MSLHYLVNLSVQLHNFTANLVNSKVVQNRSDPGNVSRNVRYVNRTEIIFKGHLKSLEMFDGVHTISYYRSMAAL